MSNNFLGEIQLFAFGYNPANWAQCNGQLTLLSQYTALFSLLGTNFGGDGRTTFGLPNFQGSAACGIGSGPGLTERVMGETFGSESVTLTSQDIPSHTHAFNTYNQTDTSKRQSAPAIGSALALPAEITPYVSGTSPPGSFAMQMVQPAGGSLPHENRQPFLAMNFCIALSGQFPARP